MTDCVQNDMLKRSGKSIHSPPSAEGGGRIDLSLGWDGAGMTREIFARHLLDNLFLEDFCHPRLTEQGNNEWDVKKSIPGWIRFPVLSFEAEKTPRGWVE